MAQYFAKLDENHNRHVSSQHLGRYIQKKTGADMLLWDGACIVHEEFRARGIAQMKALYPDAAVLVHPESPESVVDVADAVGSTSQLIKAAQYYKQYHSILACHTHLQQQP